MLYLLRALTVKCSVCCQRYRYQNFEILMRSLIRQIHMQLPFLQDVHCTWQNVEDLPWKTKSIQILETVKLALNVFLSMQKT